MTPERQALNDVLREMAIVVMRETRPEHLEAVGEALKRLCDLAIERTLTSTRTEAS